MLGIQSNICSVYIESNRNIIAAYMGACECEMIDVNSDRNATKKKRVPLTSVIGLIGSVGWWPATFGVSSGSVESSLPFITGLAGLQPLISVMGLVGSVGWLAMFSCGSSGSVESSLTFITELAGSIILYPWFVMFLDGVRSGRMEECSESH